MERNIENMRSSVDKLYFDLGELLENYEEEMSVPGFPIVLITYASELLALTEPEDGAALDVITSAVALGFAKQRMQTKKEGG